VRSTRRSGATGTAKTLSSQLITSQSS
jgi:hypothetical protein